MALSIMVFGTYEWSRKRVGFRPDLCLACDEESIAFEYRSFDVGHFWYLPLLPLGFRRHWYCARCGKDPRADRMGRGTLVFWTILVAVVGVAMWFIPIESAEDVTFAWSMRFGFPVLTLVLIALLRRRARKDIELRNRLRDVPSVGDACPLCGGRMGVGTPRRCHQCGAIEGRAPELAAS
jgi:hypothetical protein